MSSDFIRSTDGFGDLFSCLGQSLVPGVMVEVDTADWLPHPAARNPVDGSLN